jgi:prepilin-type N-terminal cleavage/methylation domain-containing protein
MKKPGFTLIELLVSIGLSAIFITSATQIFGQIYLSQKKIEISQNLYDESQFLMERITKLMRENTIDYDRYFEEVGPDPSDCSDFDTRQIPSGSSNEENNKTNRIILGYPNIFYWDTTGDGIQDSNLGGYDEDLGDSDKCTTAFYGIQDALYLINADRTMKTAIRKNVDGKIEVEREFGASRSGNEIADCWSATTNNFAGNICQIEYPLFSGNFYNVLGDNTSESFCELAHEFTVISPNIVFVDKITFTPNPDRDPFLSFRVPEARIHPNIFVSIQTSLKAPSRYSFTDLNKPWILLQTAVSSRVFGNTR